MSNNCGTFTASELSKIIDFFEPCMDDYLYFYDLKEDFYYISAGAEKRFSMKRSFNDVAAEHAKFVYPDDYVLLLEEFKLIDAGVKNYHNMQYRWLSKTGNPVWINCRGNIITDELGNPSFLVGCINEIGNKQVADNVSGLLGLTSLQDFIFNENPATASYGFLLRLGIDDFKEINENFGTDYGDIILGNTANCIKKCLRPNQRLYRLVGDEFMIIDSSGRSKKQAVELYKDIRNAIDEFVESNHFEVVFTVSGGVLPCHPNQAYSFTDRMKFSEFSLSEAKRKGKNCSYIFVMEDYTKFLRRVQVTQNLRQSINHDYKNFELFLQPLYDPNTKEIFGAESLLRFKSEELGNISPAEFIPILEDIGLIIPVGRWVLHEALHMQKEIQKIMPSFLISINVSHIQISKSNIISEIIDSVEKYEANPDTIVIELTESGKLLTDLRISRLWTSLKNKGIHLALDDFGTGASNFQYLNDLKPDIIKIDRSFTVQALTNEYEHELLKLISEMVHSMNIKICVEGIEEKEDMESLNDVNPTYYQGYFFGKPCCYEEFVNQYVNNKK